MHRKFRLAIILLGGLLAGCNTTSALVDRAGYTMPADLGGTPDAVVATAKTSYREYLTRSDDLENATYLVDVPLFGLATATVAALYYRAHRDLIAGLGIGAGAVTVAGSMLAPRTRAQVYRNGAAAMNCVIEKGRPFTTSGPALAVLNQRIGQLRQAVTGAKTYNDRNPEPKGQAQDLTDNLKARFKEAKDNLTAAITAAEKAIDTALTEDAAGAAAVDTLSSSLRNIEIQLKNQLKSQPLVFGNAISSIQNAVTAASSQVANVQQTQNQLNQVRSPSRVATEFAATDAETQISNMQAITATLAAQSRSLLDGLPRLTKAAQDVALCQVAAVGGDPAAGQ